jgi:hypothetical protein
VSVWPKPTNTQRKNQLSLIVSLPPVLMCRLGAGSTATTDNQQNDAADQTNSAENWRERNRMFLVRADVANRRFQYLLTLGVGKTAVRQCDDPDGDQDNADYSRRLHRLQGSPALD